MHGIGFSVALLTVFNVVHGVVESSLTEVCLRFRSMEVFQKAVEVLNYL